MRVQVFDGRFIATATIDVRLDDRNDNAPELHGPRTANITESAPINTEIARFVVIDRDLDGHDTAKFRINRTTDEKRQFGIEQNGVLTVAKPLDREDIPYYDLQIEAFDLAGNVGSQHILIYVSDVNDNAPSLYTEPSTCIFMENTQPSDQSPCYIFGRDPDSIENGPPFTMQLAPSAQNLQSYVDVVFNPAGNGSMTVTPLVVFDREAAFPGKAILLPIIVTDSGKPPQTATRIVTIVIGDKNDNPMTDGSMDIDVYSYQGQLQSTVIGRVYVTDLDDWDLPDKTFVWSASLAGFSLDRDSGDITMDANKPVGDYKLSATVTDSVRNEKATGYVTVHVHELSKVAFESQGSMRIFAGDEDGGISSEDFIRIDSNGQSIMSKFTSKMSEYLGGSTADIVVFSIQESIARQQTGEISVIDIRFASRSSPFASPVQLNGIVASHKRELEQLLGIIIVANPIDMCLFTQCDEGCQTVNSPSTQGVTVDANQTAIVGVKSSSIDQCTCPLFIAPTQCQGGLCLNDGVCHNTYPGFFCECRNEMLKGSRCQGKTRSFTGKGYAWYKPMPACTSLSISFEFMTSSKQDAVLFYNGPMSRYDSPDNVNGVSNHIAYHDYILVQLLSGHIKVDMIFNGNDPNSMVVLGGAPLNDNEWHTVSIRQIGKEIELVIDRCADMKVTTPPDDSMCRISNGTKDDDERLNIVDPVQIGGLAPISGGDQYPDGVQGASDFDGCIRNLIVNNDLYDLAVPAASDGSQMGCQLWGSKCSAAKQPTASYCVHGDCYASVDGPPKCNCDPGYGGDRCENKLEWIDFSGASSFVQYALNVDVDLNKTTTDVDLLFLPARTQSTADLVNVPAKSGKHVSTSIEGWLATANVDFGQSPIAINGQQSLMQSNIELQSTLKLQNNLTYLMKLRRDPTQIYMSIDDVDHRDVRLNPLAYDFNIDYDNNLWLGAADSSPNTQRNFLGCIGSFTFNKLQMPLDQSTATKMIGIDRWNVKSGCSLRKTCADLGSGYCPGFFVCRDFWKGAFCTCPDGVNAHVGDDGTLIGCGEMLAVSSLGISSQAVILILVSLAVLILLVLFMVVYTRRQTPPFERVRPEEMSRDNMRPYDIEGGGQADNDTYNITGLRKPVIPPETNGNGYHHHTDDAPPVFHAPPGASVDDNLRSMIKELEADPNATAPFDELRVYDDEGDGVSHCSLSSLSSSGGDAGELPQQLENWGPRFHNLADMYATQD